jgi:hypothetical protein
LESLYPLSYRETALDDLDHAMANVVKLLLGLLSNLGSFKYTQAGIDLLLNACIYFYNKCIDNTFEHDTKQKLSLHAHELQT